MIEIIKQWKDISLIEPSIRLLGTICELVQTFEVQVSHLKEGDVDVIIGSLAKCLEEKNDNMEIRIGALVSLRNASAFISTRIHDQKIREFVFDRLLLSLGMRDEEIVCLTYQVLIELVKGMYPYWYQIIDHIIKMSKSHLASKSPKAVTFASEFWAALASEENYRREFFRVV
jgi:hypothetical protein